MQFTVANHNNAKRAEGYKSYSDLEFSDIPDIVTDAYNYCACRLRDEYRLDDNFDGDVDILIIDIDEVCTIDEAKALFSRYEYWLITSKSHQIDKGGLTCDRFRLFFKLDKTIHIRQHMEEIYNRFIGRYSFIDTSCRNVSRFFYPSPKDAEVYHNDGKQYPTKLAVIESEVPLKGKKEDLPLPSHLDSIFRYSDATEKWTNEYGEILEGDSNGEVTEDGKLKGVQVLLDNEYVQGSKGNTLFRASAMMKKDGFDDDFIFDYLMAEWQARGSSTDKFRDFKQNVLGGLKCG